MKRMIEGLRLNVTLSEEQINQVASVTADKIDYTTRAKDRNSDFYDKEIEHLRKHIAQRDEMIVHREIAIERLKERETRLKDRVKQYEDKFGEI